MWFKPTFRKLDHPVRYLTLLFVNLHLFFPRCHVCFGPLGKLFTRQKMFTLAGWGYTRFRVTYCLLTRQMGVLSGTPFALFFGLPQHRAHHTDTVTLTHTHFLPLCIAPSFVPYLVPGFLQYLPPYLQPSTRAIRYLALLLIRIANQHYANQRSAQNRAAPHRGRVAAGMCCVVVCGMCCVVACGLCRFVTGETAPLSASPPGCA